MRTETAAMLNVGGPAVRMNSAKRHARNAKQGIFAFLAFP